MKVFHIRLKMSIGSFHPQYMKGVVIGKTRAKAHKKVLEEINEHYNQKNVVVNNIEIVETKELRSDFIMQAKD